MQIDTGDEHESALERLERQGRYIPPLADPAPWRDQPSGARLTSTAFDAVLHGIRGDGDDVIERFGSFLAASLPWAASLPGPDRDTLAVESAETLRACASIGRFTAFAELIDDWRTTAEIHTDLELAAAPSSDIDE